MEEHGQVNILLSLSQQSDEPFLLPHFSEKMEIWGNFLLYELLQEREWLVIFMNM